MDKKHYNRRPPPRLGRASDPNIANRFDSEQRTPESDGWDERNESDAPPPVETVIHWDDTKTVIAKNDSPDIPHKLSANPYRGCEHGCIYCFARPTHAYLGHSPGLDFETQLYAKQNAAALLRRELSHPAYRPDTLALGIITDGYQPAERKLGLTRAMLQTLSDSGHPVSLLTKSALIERDIDILQDMARRNLAEVGISLTSLDNTLTRRMEPRAAAPARRLKTIATLAQAGIPVNVMMAPIIPALTDHEIESLLAAAAQAGATSAGYVILRLPRELVQIFEQWLQSHLPLRAKKIMAQVRQLHGGKNYDPTHFRRHRGTGVLAQLIARRFTPPTRTRPPPKPLKAP